MKTLEELAAIRNKMKGDVTLRNEGDDKIRIVVGMATCGIAAGARPVMKTLMEEIEKRQIKNAYVTQTGCILSLIHILKFSFYSFFNYSSYF